MAYIEPTMTGHVKNGFGIELPRLQSPDGQQIMVGGAGHNSKTTTTIIYRDRKVGGSNFEKLMLNIIH